jgi:hypothetical protein
LRSNQKALNKYRRYENKRLKEEGRAAEGRSSLEGE